MNKQHVFQVAQFEFMTTLQRRSALFVIIWMPILSVLLLFGLNFLQRSTSDSTDGNNPQSLLSQLASEGDDPLPAGLVDQTGQLVFFEENEADRLLKTYPDIEVAQIDYDAGLIKGYYVIPQNYLETGQVSYYAARINAFDQTEESQLFTQLAHTYIDDPVVVERVLRPANIRETDISTTEEISSQSFGEAYALALAVSILFYITIMGSSGYLMQSLGKEKQNRVMEILLSSVQPLSLLIGKVIGLGLIGLVQLVIWGVLGLVLTQGNSLQNLTIPQLDPLTWIITLFYFMVGFLVYSSVFASVGAMAPNPKESGQITFFLMLPTFIPLWFMSAFLQSPNGGFAVGLSLFPLTTPIAMPIRMLLTTVPAWQWLVSLSLAFITSAGILWLATRVFHSNNLLSGHSLSLKGLMKALSKQS